MKFLLAFLLTILLFTPNLQAQTNLIQDGDFENQNTSWTFSTKFGVFGASPWCNGKKHALTAYGEGYAYTFLKDEFIFQAVTIPASTTEATLNFCYKINTDNVNSGVKLEVWVGPSAIKTYYYSNSNDSWKNISLPITNITDFLGKNLAIQFVVNESSTNTDWGKVYVDNVSLMVTEAACTAVSKGNTQPENKTINTGNTVTLSTSVDGTPPFSYFWYKNGVYTGYNETNTNSKTSTYTTPVLNFPDDNGNTYYCLTNNCNNLKQVQSSTATITVNSNNTCTKPSVSVNSPTGSGSVTMACTASGGGGGTILYKWYNGKNCEGNSIETGETLSVTSSGDYSCKAYITDNESTCSNCATGFATVNPINDKITGTLYDYSTVNANSSLLQNADVELLNSTGGLLSSTTTNNNGYFQFSGLSGSNYQIRVRKGNGATQVSGTTTGVNPGANLAAVKLPYTLHSQALDKNLNLANHTFDYSIGYIFTKPITITAFNTTLASSYLTTDLAAFNNNIDKKIEALQRLLALNATMNVVGDNGAEMLQQTVEEITSGLMTAFSISSFINKYNSLLAKGDIKWFKWAFYELQKETLLSKLFIIEQAIKIGISKYKNTELGPKLTQAVDQSFDLIRILVDKDQFTEKIEEELMNIIVGTIFTTSIYKGNFVTPLQNNLNSAITNISQLNYSNSTSNVIARLNTIQANSGSSYSQNYSDLVFYSTFAEGLLTGAKISSLTRVLFLNPAALTATQFSAAVLGLGSMASQGKAISTGLKGYLEQKNYALSACNSITQQSFEDGYKMFQDKQITDSLHILFSIADTAITIMQNENYSFEAAMSYARIDSNINRKVFNLIKRLNNQFNITGNELQVDSFYTYLATATQNINLRSNLSWLLASKIGGFEDQKLNDTLSYYTTVVKQNNIVTDSILDEGRLVSSSHLSPSYFTIEKIIYPQIIDTGISIPIKIISRLHSDTTLSAQLFLKSQSDTVFSNSKIFYPNINDTTEVLLQASKNDSLITLHVSTFCPEAVEASDIFTILVQSLKSSISLAGSKFLCNGDSTILIANTPINFETKWIETKSENIIGWGDSMVVFAGFPGSYRAIYYDKTNPSKYYYSENSINIENSIPLLGLDKTAIILCPTDTIDISALFITKGLTTQWSKLTSQWNVTDPERAYLGNYQLIANNEFGCKDTANVEVKQDVEIWLGSVDDNWHNPLNWSRNYVPKDSTHVIIDSTLFPCIVKNKNAVSASIWVKPGGILKVNPSQISQLKYNCGLLTDVGNVAKVSTISIQAISSINAIGTGIVINDGGTTILERGLCWNTSPYPTISNRFSKSGSGLGSFTTVLNGLIANTKYYVRAYTTNLAGTSYGNMDSFYTQATPMLDIDGNTYPSVKICNKVWTGKNLEVTHYRNGDTIPQVQDPVLWSTTTTGAWRYYQNNTENGPIYGKLYNWYAINDPRGLAPIGWHIPDNLEWQYLTDTCLTDPTIAGGKMKTTGTISEGTGLWQTNINTATNSSGFSGVPAGYCLPNGTFKDMGIVAFWWSQSQGIGNTAWLKAVDISSDAINSIAQSKNFGASVRCIKD